MMELYEIKNVEMQKLTQHYVKELTQIWTRIFDADMCRDNLDKLMEHAKNFYEELVDESLSKQSYIEKEIAELQEEAETLRRLLKTDLKLPCVNDPNMPLLVVQSEMDKGLTDLREQLRQRREQICDLLLEQEMLCDELGEPPRPLLADPLPTAAEMQEFRDHLEQLKNERLERMSKLSELRREIKAHLQVLELQVNTETESRLLNERQLKLDKNTFASLQQMHERYSMQVQELHERINAMQKQLETLWDRLKTSPNTRHKFKRYTDYTQHTYDVYNRELQRCQTLKSQNIKQYVQQIRSEIVQWWDLTLKSELQRNRFSNYNNNCYTDDLLVLHELELDDLKMYYEKNRHIFELYADRKILWERMTALEAKATDPARYNNRGGQLLKEEKERKTIASKLPKIEQHIAELVHAYTEREREPFLVNGEDILEVMAGEWEQKRQEKEKLSSARKQAQTPFPKSGMTTSRTPMSMKQNVSTASSIRKTPSTTNLSMKPPISSQKRKLNPAEKQTPVAKRSLMQALSSPSVFLRPISTASALKNHLKSPLKKSRVIAVTIRRKSGRHSNGTKKRRSLNKSACSNGAAMPRIVVSDCPSDGYVDDDENDTYDSFQKCIEPTSRSSTLLATSHAANRRHSIRSKRQMAHNAANSESVRLARIPNPRVVRTPSKQIIRHYQQRTSPTRAVSPGGASISSCSRKLTTKNLPIII